MTAYKSLEWLPDSSQLRLIDQRILPAEHCYIDCSTVEEVATAIKDMTVRGAPVIGVTAAYGLVVAALDKSHTTLEQAQQAVAEADVVLRASRPTAVNLFWALDQMHAKVAQEKVEDLQAYQAAMLASAQTLEQEDATICQNLGMNAMQLLPETSADNKTPVTFIHHCNTGALATIDYGTALGIIRTAHEQDYAVKVFVDETRPRLQGAKLTTWELQQLGIDHQLIVDGASSYVMQHHKVDLCTVGCDRVAANGDVANKIGTCNLAIVAKRHGVPFYVAAPLSTIDLETATGADIEIEEREDEEVTVVTDGLIAPENTPVFNPAFDVTPADLITAIVTEKGIAYPPFTESLRKLKEM